ncbi:MAG: choice-of-anchor U domain-containing protein [Desulfohalobiaceae bacterium]
MRRFDLFFCCWLLVGIFIFLLLVTTGRAQDSECATVTIQIKQRMTLERQAFKARMRIENGLSDASLKEVQVDIRVTDEEGNPVRISPDPDDSQALFFVRPESDGLSISGQEWTAPDVGSSSTADLEWMLIPSPGAAGSSEAGTHYSVGAELSYTLRGEEHQVSVEPDSIRVRSMPELSLDYFLPEQVYGDDAFTDEVEPPVPFTLGVRVQNSGNGTARDVSIDSAQPEIVSNEQGLEVGFEIRGSYVDAEPARDTLLVDFGDLGPKSSSVGRWIMACSLSGRFKDFQAGFSHADSLGGEMTALLREVRTHTLVRDVLVNVSGRDGVRDFLARDGDIYRVYESNGVDTRVTDQSEDAGLEQDSSVGEGYTLQLPETTGFVYVRLPDPHQGQRELASVLRSDGKRIKQANAWLSKTRKEDPTQGWNHHLNLFDVNTPGTYQLSFREAGLGPQPPGIDPISDKTGKEGEQLSFLVKASDPDGTEPELSARGLPAGAEFTDLGDGSAVFDWTPVLGQAGEYTVRFIASDGELRSEAEVGLDIAPGRDSDGDGLPDAWEEEHFGTLDVRPGGDWDGDGVSNLREYEQGSNPCESNLPPEVPRIASPADKAKVSSGNPELIVQNSQDPDQDPVRYFFEVYADKRMTEPVASSGEVVQGRGGTSWFVQADLEEDRMYYWRVRAFDGTAYSLWRYASFRVTTKNDSPEAFAPSRPAPGKTVDTRWPMLEVNNSRDPDDTPTYDFRVCADANMTREVASVSGIEQGQIGTTSWRVDSALKQGKRYYWRATASDAHGAKADSGPHAFRVDTNNTAPYAPKLHSPAKGAVINATSAELAAGNTADPDGDSVSCVFQLDSSPRFDSPELIISEAVPLQAGRASFSVSGLQRSTRYFWRVKAADENADSAWRRGTFRVKNIGAGTRKPDGRNPGNRSWVETPKPRLSLISDPDYGKRDREYVYEVYSGLNASQPVRQARLRAGSWTLANALPNRQWYSWRARAVAENGSTSSWRDMGDFFVRDNKENDPPSIEITAPQDRKFASDSLRISWEDRDPDDNADVSLYYAKTQKGRNGTEIASGIKEDPEGPHNEYIWDLDSVPEGTYLLYASISDGEQRNGSYAPGRVTVDRTRPEVAADPAGGLFTPPRAVQVQLNATEPGSIHYTLNGREPGPNSLPYQGPISLNQTTVLKATAEDRAGNLGRTSSFIYRFESSDPQPPQADAGPSRTVSEGSRIVLDGSGSFDLDGQKLDCDWSQLAGPAVRMNATADCRAEVGVPEVNGSGAVMTFLLQVTDADGLTNRDSTRLRVRSDNGTDAGNSPPDKPELVSPADWQDNVPLRAELKAGSFSDPDPGDEHIRSRWQVSRDPRFDTLVADIETDRELTSLRLPALLCKGQGTYHWRVRYVDEHGAASPWSNKRAYSTKAAPLDKNGNGVPDGQEVNATVDLDHNGVADSEQEDIAAVTSASGPALFGLKPGENATLTGAQTHKLSAYPQTGDAPRDLAHGLICVRLRVPTGSTAKLRLHSSDELPSQGTWHKRVCGRGWMDFTARVRQRSGDLALLEIRDGGEGDADGVANGRIVDPFGVSEGATDGEDSGSSQGDADGDWDSLYSGGCVFVPESDVGFGWALLLGPVLLGLALRMVLRKRRSSCS